MTGFKCACCVKAKPQRVSSPVKQGEPFNPQAKLYKTCCAHVRTASIVFGIIEIFAICFILVAVLPDMNMSVCKGLNSPKPPKEQQLQQTPPAATAANATAIRPTNADQIASLNWIRSAACDLNVVWLVWAIAQIFSVNLMFYGIKNVIWMLYLPHLIFRCACLVLLSLLCYVIFLRVSIASQTTGAFTIASVLFVIIIVFWIYIIVIEFRCMHFTKRSSDTGFSISQTRQFAPPTTSLSDHAQGAIGAVQRRGKEALQQLPPLRHGYGVKRSDANERRQSIKIEH